MLSGSCLTTYPARTMRDCSITRPDPLIGPLPLRNPTEPENFIPSRDTMRELKPIDSQR